MSNRFCWYLMPILGTMVIMQAVPIAATLALSATQVNGIAKQITVLIEGPGGNGTGVIVEKTGNTYRLLTAGHVVASINPGEEAYAITSDQQKHTIDTNNIKIISGVDLAIVEFVSDRSYSSAKLGNGERLSEGMNVYVAGFPLPTTAIDRSVYTFVPGKITSASSQGLRDGYGLIYNNDTLPGMSGGPVLNEQGEVIAIHGRADTTQTQATGYDNIYIKTGLNLGIPLSNNVLGGVNPSPSPLPSSPPTSVSPTPPPSASSLPPPPPQTALQSPPEIIIDPMDNS
ncbi:MAG: serine protease, partial [Cyanobacteria bacterium P01_G01_bin.49]